MAPNVKTTPKKPPLKVGEASFAIALAEQLLDKTSTSSQTPQKPLTIKYHDHEYSPQEVIDGLVQFSLLNNLGFKTLEFAPGSLKQFLNRLLAFQKESQLPNKAPEGNIPDYITIPDQNDPKAGSQKLQVEKYLSELKSQIKDIEKRNLDQKLAEARQNIFKTREIIQEQITQNLSSKIPKASVQNILEIDQSKFTTALEYAAAVSTSQEELVRQTIDSFSQSSLGGKFLANRLSEADLNKLTTQINLAFRQNGLSPKINTSFAAFRELQSLTSKLTSEHFIVGFYQSIKSKQPTLTQEQAVTQALKAHQALILLSQTNQPVFLDPKKYQEAFVLSLKQTGVSSQTISTLGFGNNTPTSELNELMLASFVQNKTTKYAHDPITKQFAIPGGSTLNTQTINTTLQGGLSIFGLDSLLATKDDGGKNIGQKTAADINSLLDNHHTDEAEGLLTLLSKKRGLTGFLQRRRAYNMLRQKLGGFQDQARLLLLIEKLQPGLLPKELLSGARFIASPLRQIGGWASTQTTKLAVAASRWLARLTAKAAQWVAVNSPKILAALGSIAKAIAALIAAFGWEILIITIIVVVIILLVLLISRVAQTPLETSHEYPLPKEVASVPFTPNLICSPEKAPVGLPRGSGAIAGRAWDIASDLYQGFWCFWNRSADASHSHPPVTDLDTCDTGFCFPEIFWYDLYMQNPNPPVSQVSVSSESLFWCTQLTYQSYVGTGNNVFGVITFMSDGQLNDFRNRGKYIPAAQVTPGNAIPGSIVFFHVENSDGREANHVGILNNVGTGYIGITQSNAGSKDDTINFKAGGVGLSDLPGIKVVGIGNP